MTNIFGPGDYLQLAQDVLLQSVARNFKDGRLVVKASSWKSTDTEASVLLEYQGSGAPFTAILRVAKSDMWKADILGPLDYSMIKRNVHQVCVGANLIAGSRRGFYVTRLPYDNSAPEKGHKYFAELYLHGYAPDHYIMNFMVQLHDYNMSFSYNNERATRVEKTILSLLQKLTGVDVELPHLHTFIYACLTGDLRAGAKPFMLLPQTMLEVYERSYPNEGAEVYFYLKHEGKYLNDLHSTIWRAMALTL